MQYVGGKATIAREIVAVILADTPKRDVWFEPFVGGANVTEKAVPHFRAYECHDANPDLITMWQAIMAGWSPPETLTKEEYRLLKASPMSPLRGFAAFGASFGGKFWGGYGESSTAGKLCEISSRVVRRQADIFRGHKINFRLGKFALSYEPLPGSVVYCDPPYAGTTSYKDSVDAGYYKTLSRWAAMGCEVYASEYSEPTVPFKLLWSKLKRKRLGKDENSSLALEKLFKIL
jgi:DNA adenine methylase